MKPPLPATPPLSSLSVPLLLLAWTGCSVSTIAKGSTGGACHETTFASQVDAAAAAAFPAVALVKDLKDP